MPLGASCRKGPVVNLPLDSIFSSSRLQRSSPTAYNRTTSACLAPERLGGPPFFRRQRWWKTLQISATGTLPHIGKNFLNESLPAGQSLIVLGAIGLSQRNDRRRCVTATGALAATRELGPVSKRGSLLGVLDGSARMVGHRNEQLRANHGGRAGLVEGDARRRLQGLRRRLRRAFGCSTKAMISSSPWQRILGAEWPSGPGHRTRWRCGSASITGARFSRLIDAAEVSNARSCTLFSSSASTHPARSAVRRRQRQRRLWQTMPNCAATALPRLQPAWLICRSSDCVTR